MVLVGIAALSRLLYRPRNLELHIDHLLNLWIFDQAFKVAGRIPVAANPDAALSIILTGTEFGERSGSRRLCLRNLMICC